MDLDFIVADPSHAKAIVKLVDSVYRGPSSRLGWTTEADILDGQRTDEGLILAEMQKPHSVFLVGLSEGQLVTSLQLESKSSFVYLGMVSIHTSLQNQGVGKKLLRYAEQFALQRWQVSEIKISVIHLRSELISWYERQGYRLTGKSMPFPDNPRYGIPRVAHLELLELSKSL